MYKKLAVDRSTTYAKAIKNPIPTADQIADRFDIIHNFFEGVSDFLKRYMGKSIKIVIDKNGATIDKKNKSEPTDKCSKRLELIIKVRDIHNSGIPIKAIVRELSISRNTIRKYINLKNI